MLKVQAYLIQENFSLEYLNSTPFFKSLYFLKCPKWSLDTTFELFVLRYGPDLTLTGTLRSITDTVYKRRSLVA